MQRDELTAPLPSALFGVTAHTQHPFPLSVPSTTPEPFLPKLCARPCLLAKDEGAEKELHSRQWEATTSLPGQRQVPHN